MLSLLQMVNSICSEHLRRHCEQDCRSDESREVGSRHDETDSMHDSWMEEKEDGSET